MQSVAKMQGLVLKLWRETGKAIILITQSIEEALLLGERLIVMAPRPGRIHREYRLPFAERGVHADLREVKRSDGFARWQARAFGWRRSTRRRTASSTAGRACRSRRR